MSHWHLLLVGTDGAQKRHETTTAHIWNFSAVSNRLEDEHTRKYYKWIDEDYMCERGHWSHTSRCLLTKTLNSPTTDGVCFHRVGRHDFFFFFLHMYTNMVHYKWWIETISWGMSCFSALHGEQYWRRLTLVTFQAATFVHWTYKWKLKLSGRTKRLKWFRWHLHFAWVIVSPILALM